MFLPCFIGGCVTPAAIVLKTPVGQTKYKPLCKDHYHEIVNSIKQLKNAEESGGGTEVSSAFIRASETASTMSIEEYDNMIKR